MPETERRRAAISRRLAISSTLSTLGTAACGQHANPTPPAAPSVPPVAGPASRIIDAHCHVFNVDDLPVYRFLRHVVLPDRCFENLDALAWLLARFVKSLAPGLAAERRALEASGITSVRAPSEVPQRRQDSLSEALRALRSAALRGRPRPAGRELELDRALDAPPLTPTDQAEALLRSLSSRTTILRETPGNRGPLPSDAELNAIARRLTGSLAGEASTLSVERLSLFGGLGGLIAWAAKISGFRRTLVTDLATISGGPARPVLLTPALVDFGPWISADRELPGNPAAVIPAQMEIMRLIAAKRPGSALVHPFVPYDPWRAAADTASDRPNGPLAEVREAITNQGAVGVKLYPPMGFRAWHNTGVPDGGFPKDLQNQLRQELGQKLDQALREIYEECIRLEVPVMAHCADSNEARPGSGLFASPEHWEAAVEQFPGLRINLGHFGGVWLLDGPEQRCDERVKTNWTDLCAEIIARHPTQVWADLSYFSEVLRSGEHRQKAIEKLKSFASHPAAANFLYGSDWIMVGQEAGSDEYAAMVSSAASEAGLSAEEFSWRAAARFLGLDRPGQQRNRLLAFHANGPGAEAIRQFMPGL
jgi:predicted TIM-barrel fold metal-dependent hydrolase